MATAGPRYPGTVATEVGPSGDNDWTNPGNISADDGTEAQITAATYDAGDHSYRLKATNFGFDAVIGPLDTITGITVEIDRRDFAGDAQDQEVRLYDSTGTLVGDDKQTATSWPATLTVATYGGTSDTWAAGLDAADIRSANFGVALIVLANSANTDIAVDFIRVTITYTEGPKVVTVPLLDAGPALYAPTLADPNAKQILLVVADAGAPTTDDASLKTQLEGLGHIVTYISDETAEASSSSYDLAVISESVTSTTVGTKYKTWTKPTMVMEQGCWDDHDLASSGNILATQSQFDILVGGDPIAAGYTGTQSFVASGTTDICWADTWGPDAVKVIATTGSTTQIVAGRYESGTTGTNSYTIPARRVALGYNGNTIAHPWGTVAKDVFDAAIEWLLGGGTSSITLGLLTSTSALYAPTILPQPVTVSLGLLDATATLYAPTLTPKNTVTLGLLDAGAALYAPTVIPGPVTVSLGLIDAGPALYQPTLTPKNTLTLGLLDAGPALYAPTLVPGPAQLTLGLIDAGPALYAPTLAPQPVTISLGLIDGGAALYAPTLVGKNTISLGLLDAGPAVYAPTVIIDQFVTVPLLDASPSLFAPTVTTENDLSLTLLDASAALYAPVLTTENDLVLGLLDAGPALYDPTLAQTGGSGQGITLGLLDAGSALYAPTLAVGPVGITVPLLDAAAALYAPTLHIAQFLTLPLLDASPAVYAPEVTTRYLIELGLLDASSSLFAPTLAISGGGAQGVTLDLLDGGAALYAPVLSVPTISGFTRTNTGEILPLCEVHVFRTVDDVEVAQTTSDANGAYSVEVAAGVEHYLVAYKVGSPDRAGTTVNTLVGT